MRAERLPGNPIIRPRMDGRMGDNVNGPSLIRVPDWLPDPLGRYYLYFAHHGGKYIGLAYADRIEGPWRTHEPGTLALDEAHCEHHVASPDIHVDHTGRRIRMYYHGVEASGEQVTRVALSADGVHFAARPEVLGTSYWRVFEWDGWHYAVAMPGRTYRSRDPLSGFVEGPDLGTPRMRHAAVKIDGHVLTVFYSRKGDCPEHIVCATLRLTADWQDWRLSEPQTLVEPEAEWEGAGLPLGPSRDGWAPQPVRQLRDPAVYREDGRTYLLYSVAGEHGIAIAELTE